MSDEEQSKLDTLSSKFPNVFPPYDPLYPLGPNNHKFSFSCGDGWYQLLHDCAETIENELLKLSVRDRVGFRAVQVKEKFGTLRFYIDGYGNPVIDKAIQDAENRSEVTCEECGEKGRLRGGGWMKTLCDPCELRGIIAVMVRNLEYTIEKYDHVITYGENKGKVQERYRFKEKDKQIEELLAHFSKKVIPMPEPEREKENEETPTDSSPAVSV